MLRFRNIITGKWLTLVILGLITEKLSLRTFILPGALYPLLVGLNLRSRLHSGDQARNQLGTPGGAKTFLKGVQFF